MIRILTVEDSDVVALLLKAILDQEPDMQVVGHARNGSEALSQVQALQPDLVTMDIRMPVLDGFEATRLIMAQHPTPIVVVSSSVDEEELHIISRAIEEGALAVLEKPRDVSHPNFEASRRELVDTIRAMAEVKLVRRRFTAQPSRHASADTRIFTKPAPQLQELVAIGVSTGGPQVLQSIFAALPADFPVPVLVAQHISKGFLGGLVNWLRDNSPLRIKVAESGEALEKGCVYFAPDDYHLMVRRNSRGLAVQLDQGASNKGFRPSASNLFDSVAQTCGSKAVGVLLTGMGSDGARGLLAMHRRGAHTLVQDEQSAVVYGMPAAALALDAVSQVVPLEQLPAQLLELARG